MSEINDIEEIPKGTFPINLKLIRKHKQSEQSITAKYKDSMYHKDYFCGGSNIDLKLITCNRFPINTSKLRSTLVPYISTSPRNGYNGGDDLPTFVLARHQRCRPEGSK